VVWRPSMRIALRRLRAGTGARAFLSTET